MNFPSKYFLREEFACRCGCGQDWVDAELLEILKIIRRRFGLPVHVISGNRCLEYNRTVGSKDTSQHIKGKAADIMIIGVRPGQIFSVADKEFPDAYGLGLYRWGVHVDCRGEMARW